MCCGGERRGGTTPVPPEPPPTELLLLLPPDEGNFQRIGEQSYLSQDMQFATWYWTDLMRIRERGVLQERSFINRAFQSIEVGTTWTAVNGAGVGKTVGAVAPGSAPDGTLPAQMTYGSAANSRLTQTVGTSIPDGIPIVLTGFFMGAVAGRGNQPAINASIDATQAIPNGSWVRHVKRGNAGVAISDVIFFDNDIATTQVVASWGLCLNDGTYPMTPTRSLATNFTTNPDVLTFLSAQVPLAVREAFWTATVIPEWAPADLVAGDQRWVVSFGSANDGLRFRHTGADVRLEAVVGGVVVATSIAIAGSVIEVPLAISVDPVNAVITVNAVAGAAGTPWAWPGGVMVRLFAILAGLGELDGYTS